MLESRNPVIAAALSAWVLLKSLKPKYLILNDSLPDFAASVLKCLQITDMGVRIAAAKCLVFMKELMNMVGCDVG